MDGRKVEPPAKPREVPKTGDSMQDALNAAIAVHERAYEEFEKAMCHGQTGKVSALLHVHTKALEARIATEEACRKEMERRGILVEKGAIIDITRRCMDSVLRRLKKLPQEKGPECNPENPLVAVGILELEVNNIIATGQKALEALDS